MKKLTRKEVEQIIAQARTNAQRPDLSRVTLTGLDLAEISLVGVNLTEADLRWANLFQADLFGANLKGADLRGANLAEANLSWANLSQADLVELIETKRQKDREKVVHNWEEEGIRVEKARWGRHNILKGKTKIELPKTVDAEALTLDEVKEMLEKNVPKKATSKRKAAKKK